MEILVWFIKCQQMVENVDQCFPKAHDDVLKCLILSTTQRYSVHCHRGEKKLEQYSHGITEVLLYLHKKMI